MSTSLASVNTGLTVVADWRATGKAVSDALSAVGLTKTADTGQIDWATVALPVGANAVGGYEIWRFNDTLQATKPIFLKIEYGVGSSSTRWGLWVTVGTGSNGSGTLTGQQSSRRMTASSSTWVPGTYPIYVCYNAVAGFLGVVAYPGAIGASGGAFFMVARTCDDAGVPIGEGYSLYWYVASNQPNTDMVSFDTGIVASQTLCFCQVTGNVNNAVVGVDVQVFKHYTVTPRVRTIPQMLTFLQTEIANATQFSVTPFGTTAHMYIAFRDNVSGGWGGTALATAHVLAMLWE